MQYNGIQYLKKKYNIVTDTNGQQDVCHKYE